jgi:hypothetical protein
MHAETKIPRGIESTIQAATMLSTMAMMGPLKRITGTL